MKSSIREQRIRKELKDTINGIEQIEGSAGPDPLSDNIFHWEGVFTGPPDTPYSRGRFHISIDFPDDYPKVKPNIKFITKIYHPNINLNTGEICISCLNLWQSDTTINEILIAIHNLLETPGPIKKGFLNSEAGEKYYNKKEEFDKEARSYTIKYAHD